MYEESCRGKRSVSITARFVTGTGARGHAAAQMEATAERPCRTRGVLADSGVCAGQDLCQPLMLAVSLLDGLIGSQPSQRVLFSPICCCFPPSSCASSSVTAASTTVTLLWPLLPSFSASQHLLPWVLAPAVTVQVRAKLLSPFFVSCLCVYSCIHVARDGRKW